MRAGERDRVAALRLVLSVLAGLAGACLTIDAVPVAYALGDGCPAMTVTAYSDVPASRLPYRNISIDLVEV